MSKTVEEIEKLKKDWESDPCWDLYDTEGFEDHVQELKEHQLRKEMEWKIQRIRREKEIDAQADDLGVRGLYRLILEHKELLNRHDRAIHELGEGNTLKAYRILQGYED